MADEALKKDEPTARAARALPNEAFEFRGGRQRDGAWSGVLGRVEDA
jgi:hypothetical protein